MTLMLAMGDTAVASVLAALIAGAVAWLTSISNRKAQVEAAQEAASAAVINQSLSSRTEIEKEAFERAKGYYTDTMDRQQAEINGLVAKIQDLSTRVMHVEGENEHLKSELALAKELLARKYPDE